MCVCLCVCVCVCAYMQILKIEHKMLTKPIKSVFMV